MINTTAPVRTRPGSVHTIALLSAAAVAAPAAYVLAAGDPTGTPLSGNVISLIGNGGVGVALVIVVRLFLQHQTNQNADFRQALRDFRNELATIQERHLEAEKQAREEIRGLVIQHLTLTERIAESLAQLKTTLTEYIRTTQANENSLRLLESRLSALIDRSGKGADGA